MDEHRHGSIEVGHPPILPAERQQGRDVGDDLGKNRQLDLWHRLWPFRHDNLAARRNGAPKLVSSQNPSPHQRRLGRIASLGLLPIESLGFISELLRMGKASREYLEITDCMLPIAMRSAETLEADELNLAIKQDQDAERVSPCITTRQPPRVVLMT